VIDGVVRKKIPVGITIAGAPPTPAPIVAPTTWASGTATTASPSAWTKMALPVATS
jgi:Ni,Fe-hydrogenase III small subunit